MAYPIDGRVGHIFANESSIAQSFMRDRVRTSDGDYVLGRAQGDLTTALWCTMMPGGTVRSMTGANVLGLEQVVLAVGSVTSANYGWFQANGKNMHGLVSTTLQSANRATSLFVAIDSPAGNLRLTTVGPGTQDFSTAGSVNPVFLPMLKLVTGNASTSTSAIFESAGDVYGMHILDRTTTA